VISEAEPTQRDRQACRAVVRSGRSCDCRRRQSTRRDPAAGVPAFAQRVNGTKYPGLSCEVIWQARQSRIAHSFNYASAFCTVRMQQWHALVQATARPVHFGPSTIRRRARGKQTRLPIGSPRIRRAATGTGSGVDPQTRETSSSFHDIPLRCRNLSRCFTCW
jgi:hypothetical protein